MIDFMQEVGEPEILDNLDALEGEPVLVEQFERCFWVRFRAKDHFPIPTGVRIYLPKKLYNLRR